MRKFLCAALILGLAGCGDPAIKQVTANLDYADTSLGFRNSGVLSAGRLMLWDLDENTLVTLATDIKMTALAPTAPRRLEATKVRGADFGANVSLSSGDQATLNAAVNREVKFVVKDAVRIDNKRTYSAISAAYRALGADGVNAVRAFRVQDATSSPNKYKYVLLTDEVQASSETLELTSGGSASAGIQLGSSDQGKFNVSFPRSTTAKCSGTGVTCYVNASVMTVFLNDNGGLDYAPFAYDRAKLSEALRGSS